MSSKTKILIFKKKEILYTILFAALAVLLVVLLYFMFFLPRTSPMVSEEAETASVSYVPGMYTTSISLGEQSLDVEVTVDADHINSIRLVDLTDAITTMYPLVEPAIDSLSMQILQTQSPDAVTYSEDTRYTSALLLDAIQTALAKARKP